VSNVNSSMVSSARQGQHRSVTAVDVTVLPESERPESGPIAVVPADAFFENAVTSAGGIVEPLNADTRGLIWLDYAGVDALRSTLAEHPQISWVQFPYAGVDSMAPLLSSYAAGTAGTAPLFTSAKGAYAQPVAEHALMLVLALLRDIPTRVRAESWPSGHKTGTSLFGLNVLIIGAGGIAIELMRLLEPFGVHVTIVRRSSTPVPGAERTLASAGLDGAIPEADVIVVAAAFTDGTHKLIGAPQLALMKATAVLVNIARGGLIDTDALVASLAGAQIAGAGLDVTDPEPLPDGHPLWNEPRVIITPHSADTPEMTAPLLATRIRENVEAFLETAKFTGIVDPKAGY
jgi:phosphoglycerate dehydrogenase-like enzyme